jgi:hypothetical protein
MDGLALRLPVEIWLETFVVRGFDSSVEGCIEVRVCFTTLVAYMLAVQAIFRRHGMYRRCI